MKNNNFYIRTITFVCAFLQIFAFVGITSFAYSNNGKEETYDVNSAIINDSSTDNVYSLNNSAITNPPELDCVISNPIVPIDDFVRVAFDSTNVVDYTYSSEGLEVTDNNDMTFDIEANSEFGVLQVTAYYNDDVEITKRIYTYKDDNSVYTSKISKDDAWHNCYQNKLSVNGITLKDLHRAYSYFSLVYSEYDSFNNFTNTPEINTAISNGRVVVRGRMTWEDKNGNVIPLRYVRIDLMQRYFLETYIISFTYTDADGYYYFIIDPDDYTNLLINNIDLFVRTYTESCTFNLHTPFIEKFNYFDSHTVQNVDSSSGIINISRKVLLNEDYLFYKSICVHQGIVVGQRFAQTMGLETPADKLTVFYPVKISNLFDEQDALCLNTVSLIGLNKYTDFYTLIHEYGHYVENRMGNYGFAVLNHIPNVLFSAFDGTYNSIEEYFDAVLQIPSDYEHSKYDNHFDENTDKDFQMELTWSESWAYAFAEVAIEKYKTDYLSVNHINNYEYFIADTNSGEAQEYAVTAFLWDLYDDTPSEPGDNISLNEKEWWNLTTQTGTYTIQDLTDNIIENYPDLINGVGEILSKHSIAPQLHGVNNSPCVNIPPKIRIEMNGSSSHPNNIFKIVFYDENNNIVSSTINVNTSKSNNAFFVYTVSNDIWADVVEHYVPGKTIYATIYGYRTGEFTSGPYFSKYVKVLDNSMFHNYHSMEYDNTNHWEQCLCGGKRNVTSHNFTYGGFTDLGHNMVCSGCGYTVLKAHVYEYTSNGDAVHSKECACGYIVTSEEHYAFSYKSVSSSNHKVYCVCGKYIRSENHTTVTIAPLKAHCNVCGAVFNIGYDFIIKGTEDEEDPCTE